MSHGGHGGHSHDDAGHAHDSGHSHGGNSLQTPLLGGGCCAGHGEGDKGHSHEHAHDHGHADHHGHGHGHSHGEHGHDHHEEPATAQDQQRLKMAVWFAASFMLVEICGGLIANSLAIITDAAHMLSDTGGFIVSLVALQLSMRGATEDYTYGFKQAEVLGALLTIAIVWALTAILLWKAIPRFQQPEKIEAPVMFTISVIGFAVNLVLMRVLGHGHSHGGGGHGHSHGGHDDDENMVVQAALAHVIGDIVQSLGVCAASLLIWFGPRHWDIGETCTGDYCVSNWNYADPLCTVLFGVLVLMTTKATFVRTIETLMGKAPRKIDQNHLTHELEAIPAVESIHDLHVWPLGSKDVLCTAHIVVSSGEHSTAVLNAAIKAANRSGIGHVTFQIEISGEFDPTCGSRACYNGGRNPSSPDATKDGHGHAHEEHGHSHDHGHAQQHAHSHV